MKLTRRENALKNLKKINKKWKKLKQSVKIENCLENNEFLYFNNKKWIKESNYIERINKTPFIINILSIKYFKNKIKIKYDYYNPHKKSKEILFREIPLKFKLDEEFLYFLGLWCGDRFRVGISNSCLELLGFTSEFLRKRLEQPEGFILGEVLSSHELSKEEWKLHDKILKKLGATKIRNRIDKRKINRKNVSYAILLSNNYIIWHIFRTLENNLDIIFNNLNEQFRYAFYAGFFDAEGYVDKYHKLLEFHQYIKNYHIVKPLLKHLKKDKFNVFYYNGKVIRMNNKNNNFELFYKKIFPYLRHPDKISEIQDLISNNLTKREYILFIYWISKNPNKTSKEIAKSFNQSYVHTLLKISALFKQGIICRKRKGRAFYYYITEKGEKMISVETNLINHILKQLKLYGSWKNSYFSSCSAVQTML